MLMYSQIITEQDHCSFLFLLNEITSIVPFICRMPEQTPIMWTLGQIWILSTQPIHEDVL